MLKIEAQKFDAARADDLIDLIKRAYSIVPEDARPKDTADFLIHMFGAANPSGIAYLVCACDDGRLMGTISAMPMRFRRADGSTIVSYQLNNIAVDPALTRQGIGQKLLKRVAEAVFENDRTFLYGYPNKRADPLYDRLGYMRLPSVPTRIHVPTPSIIAASGSRCVKTRDGAANFEFISVESARSFLTSTDGSNCSNEQQSSAVGVVRDAAYFAWRFLGPNSDRYSFITIKLQKKSYLVALAKHGFKGIKFTVLVDTFPSLTPDDYTTVISCAQAGGWTKGQPFLYINTNISTPIENPFVSLGVDVPDSANPRPCKVVLNAKSVSGASDELRQSLAMTADWMGF